VVVARLGAARAAGALLGSGRGSSRGRPASPAWPIRLRWQEELDRLGEQVERGAQQPSSGLDRNGRKGVNDAHGHDAGDEYLRAAAEALRGAARDQDLVARLGGDEFGVLVPGAGPDLAERLVERVRDALAAAPAVHGTRVTAAVGTATCPPHRTLRAAFVEADRAMYADKQARRRQR
jgi:diguanylate cyclase (GGDEF)-like protein